MKIYFKYFFAICFFCSTHVLYSQTYNMASWTITTCSGTFYDQGGAGNYANNLNVTETFCATAGSCLSMNFTSFRTQGGNDFFNDLRWPKCSIANYWSLLRNNFSRCGYSQYRMPDLCFCF